MDITVSYEQGRVPVTVFHLQGDLTAENQLSERAKQAYEDGTRNLLLDLTEVPYISSGGLRALHHIYMLLRTDAPEESDQASKAGILAGTFTSPHLKLLKPSKNAEKVLSLAGYDTFLEIHQDLRKAIDSF